MTEKQIPSIGRIVHYRLDTGRNVGEYRPAIITRVWSPGSTDSPCQLQVFTDGANDGLDSIHWATSRVCGEDTGQWKWPEYVKPHMEQLAQAQ